MKSSAAFASGLWIGALAVALAGGIYLYTSRDGNAEMNNKNGSGSPEVADKLKSSQAECARLGAEIIQLKRTIEEQRRQANSRPTLTEPRPAALPEPTPVPEPGHEPAPVETPPNPPEETPPNGLVATDEATGITVTLDPSGLALNATNEAGSMIWRVRLESPAKSVSITNGQVMVTFSATVPMDLASGKRLN
jgi:hypothetical protein